MLIIAGHNLLCFRFHKLKQIILKTLISYMFTALLALKVVG